MATINLPQVLSGCQKLSVVTPEILESVDRLLCYLDERKGEVSDQALLDSAVSGMNEFRRRILSVDSLREQLENKVSVSAVAFADVEVEAWRLGTEVLDASELFFIVYRQLCDFETGVKFPGDKGRLYDLVVDDLLDGLNILLDAAEKDSVVFSELRRRAEGDSAEIQEDLWDGAEAERGECCIPEPDAPFFAEMEEVMPAPPMPAPPVGAVPAAPFMPAPPMPAPPSAAGQSPAGSAKKVKPVRMDSVSFSVLSPERVKAGEYSSIDVYMYTKSQRKIIEKAIKAAKEAVKETGKSGFSVSRGTEVSIILTSDDVKITDEMDTRTWNGDCCKFDFQFFVPEDYRKKQIAFTCQVLFGGIQITRLHFTVSLSAGAARVPVKVRRKDCRKAFVSYSHKDESRVLNQLSAIAEVAPRLVFWLDSQSMENGDIWRQEIRRAIRNADVFLLFWSVYSAKSDEVEKEWRYAKKKKGIRFILPVPLDPPSECPPPEELGKHLHFNHRSLAYTEGMDGLKFASSKQFRRIK